MTDAELKSVFLDEAERRYEAVMKAQERLLEAWIAETGLRPSESVLVVEHTADGGMRIYVRRRYA